MRFAGRIEESVEFGVVRREGSAPYVGVAVVAHVHALDGALAALHHRLGELHGVGLEALQIVLARRQFIYHVGLTTQTFDVHVSVGSQELVERHAQQRRLLDLDAHAQKSAAVALELVYSASLLHGVVHSVIGICHAARQQSLRGLLGERDGLDRLPIDLPGPVVERRIESVTLGERALYAEARHVGPALLQIVRGEFAARGRHDLAADLHLGLQERRLVEQIVVRLVVARHLDGDHVAAAAEAAAQIVTVDAIEVVRRDARAVGHESAVDAQAIVGRCGDADQRIVRRARIDHLAERQGEILLRLAPLGPHGQRPRE